MDLLVFHRISKALADPRRFAILEQIAGTAELACQALIANVPVTKATLSHHLQELETAGLISIRMEGKFAHLALRKAVWREYRKELRKRIG
jgi:ArsR family transcriptional regulator